MKNKSVFFLVFILFACKQPATQPKEDMYVIDVSKKYPTMKLSLQNISDVEYIPLYSDGDFITSSKPRVINENYIIVFNYPAKEFLIFDRKGEKHSRFSKYGNGPHEYLSAAGVIYDEDENELFIRDPFSSKIIVYNIQGDFLRELPNKDGAYYKFMYNYDKSTLLCYKQNPDVLGSVPSYLMISKADGSVLNEINLPFDQVHSLNVRVEGKNGDVMLFTEATFPAVKSGNMFYLNELSSDTIYKLNSNNGELLPYIVREPKINSMQIPVYLQAGLETSQYLFMSIVKKDISSSECFSTKNLAIDKKSRKVYEVEVFNEDFPKHSILFDPRITDLDIFENHGLIRLPADLLKKAYDKDELSGPLKKVSSLINEDDNEVVMLLKFK